ncbi:MAG: nicotinamide mononucleotide transporter [Clostridia bacterium]|nr:nicotinamide mononucleotide transporter [Clostridia bacterium]
MNKLNTKNIILIITYAAIIVTGIMFRQSFYMMLPLFVSVIVMALQGTANRYGYLLGSINALLYTFAYIQLGTYANALSAMLISFPMQMITFLHWKSRSYEKSVVFKKMSCKLRIFTFVTFIVTCVICFTLLKTVGSLYAVLDTLSTIIGVYVTILTLFAYIEYTYLWPLNGVISILLNIQVTMNEPSAITYAIFSFYSLYCVILAYINAHKLYKKQKSEVLESEN